MKTTIHVALRACHWALALALLSILNLEFASAFAAQGTTAFTYQGLLNERGAAVNGSYDFRFTIYDKDTGGTSALEPVAVSRVAVSNGLFTVALDFGALGSTPRWLEIEVRSRDLGGDYTVLTPRQLLTATPQAHYALQAGDVLNPVPEALIPNSIPRLGGTNTFTGPVRFEGSERPGYPPFTVGLPTLIPNLNASYLNGMEASFFWQLFGNTDTEPGLHFVGTRDNQPLELRVNLKRALRLEPTVEDANNSGIVNVVGGSVANFVGPGRVGATIGGGGAQLYYGGAGGSNSILGDFGTIGGGYGNAIDFNFGSVIGGGNRNSIQLRADNATIGGGFLNAIQTNAYNSTIAGGDDNVIEAVAVSSVVGGGSYNRIQRHAHHSVLAGGEFNVIGSNSTYSVIGGGHENTIGTNAMESVIGGGSQNRIGRSSPLAVIDGGAQNRIGANAGAGTIGGGALNVVEDDSGSSTIGGGWGNEISNVYATVGGGYYNTNSGYAATVGGGEYNTASAIDATVGGGIRNTASAFEATVSGGYRNTASGSYATVGGGESNAARAGGATVGGGEGNEASALFATVSGGIFNAASGYGAVVGGGPFNAAGGFAATVPGGQDNVAQGDFSFAAGNRAKANHAGSFVWSDSTDADFSSTASNQVSFRCLGGVRFTSGAGGGNQQVAWTPGSASWSFSSDRNLKEGIRPVDGEAVLDKVARLPISEWNYKGHGQRHIGPMAQDFHEAFPLNESTTTLNDADLHGVALAAIQGLNEKVEVRMQKAEDRSRKLEEELKRRDGENAELKARLTKLEEVMAALSAKGK